MTGTTRFLIIEDHPLFQQALRKLLQQTDPDAEIKSASSIDNAITILQSGNRFTLALLDLHLPCTNDFSGLLSLQKQFPRLPIAVVSSLDDADIMRDALRLGAIGFIPKSFLKKDFKRIIGKILQGKIYAPPVIINTEPCASRAVREETLKVCKTSLVGNLPF